MQSYLWLPLALGSAFFAALVAIFSKIGISRLDTSVATAVRAGVMFAVLMLFIAASGKVGTISSITKNEGLYIVLAGLAGAASWLFYFWALKVGKASQVAPIDRVSAVITVLLAALFLAEKVSWKTATGAVIMTIGAIFVALG